MALSGPKNQSAGAFNRYNRLFATANDQVLFTLTEAPPVGSVVKAEVNGAGITQGDHFTVSGSILTFLPGAAGYDLELVNEFGNPDRMEVWWMA